MTQGIRVAPTAACQLPTDRPIVVAPDDVPALKAAISGLHARWEKGALDNGSLPPELKEQLSRRARSQEFAELLKDVA